MLAAYTCMTTSVGSEIVGRGVLVSWYFEGSEYSGVVIDSISFAIL